jgi:hypothetical protein
MFALAYGYQPIFPASDAALRAYLAFMSISCSPQSLRIYLSGLRQAHLDQGFEWVTASARHFVWKTYCGIKRMHGRPSKPKLAVTLNLLHEFARQILANQTRFFFVWWADALVAFFLLLRKDNVTVAKKDALNKYKGLQRGDLEPIGGTWDDPPGTITHVLVTLRHSKTNQQGTRVHSVTLMPVLGPDGPHILCPIEALRRIYCGTRPSKTEAAFFIPMVGAGGTGLPMTHAQFVKQLKVCVSNVPGISPGTYLNPADYSGHSFRRGGATLAFETTTDHALIQNLGDWTSMAYLGYRELTETAMQQLPRLLAAAAGG